ncbi:MAG TPA: MOSC domain-containing protein [Candidatus Acidoferrales bacterium]|nr:MOSC domain-containing protein [Candidatus Acidoferrales bacterium]
MDSQATSTKLGSLEILRRYPFKGMRGEDIGEVFVTYPGLIGDRAYAFVDPSRPANLPWMTGRLAREMILFQPRFLTAPDPKQERPSPRDFLAEVTTPEGEKLSLQDSGFTAYFEKRFGRALELRFSERAMQDACPVSLLGLDSVDKLSDEAGFLLDHRRFRANFYVRWENRKPFYEHELVGAKLRIGEKLIITVVKNDQRCVIINLDPATAEANPKVLEAVTHNHASCCGIYASVVREGIVRRGDSVCAV